MSEALRPVLTLHDGPEGVVGVWMPFDFEAFAAAADATRRALVRRVPAAFTRDEWAYLLASLSRERLMTQRAAVFGPTLTAKAPPRRLARPRGTVAIWLPANVSLLGPLAVLATLASGNHVRTKGSARATDLVGAFLTALREASAPLVPWLDRVEHAVFDRDDPRNAGLAADADVRIVFGSDDAARAVHALPAPLGSVAYSFVDRRSEAWIEAGCESDATLRSLVEVFAIYGQAGCTSPSRVLHVGADLDATRALRDRLVALWPSTVHGRQPMHVASDNTRLAQWAAVQGWDAVRVPSGEAVVACGEASLPRLDRGMVLWLSPATPDEAFAGLPSNIQTIGHALRDPAAWLEGLGTTAVRRWVPLRSMHHFGWAWDGEEYWRGLFRWTECAA